MTANNHTHTHTLARAKKKRVSVRWFSDMANGGETCSIIAIVANLNFNLRTKRMRISRFPAIDRVTQTFAGRQKKTHTV